MVKPVILSSPGFANVMGFRSDDDVDYCVDRVVSVMTSECLALRKKSDVYHINIDKSCAMNLLVILLLCF